MSAVEWQCPHCNHFVTITNDRESSGVHHLSIDNSIGSLALKTLFYVCPNPSCKRPTCTVDLLSWSYVASTSHRRYGKVIRSWRLYPEGASRPFPDYIPQAILNDYREACQIVDLSPKASATLSRRALQGILRDFWKVTPKNLWQEIQQIEDRTDGLTWNAIDAVRQIGNIGAHMENDINVIVDVDSGEADMLIQLVETLLTEWYVARNDREERMKVLAAAAAAKRNPPATMAE